MRTMDVVHVREKKKKREREEQSLWGQKEQESLFQLLPLVPETLKDLLLPEVVSFQGQRIGLLPASPSPSVPPHLFKIPLWMTSLPLGQEPESAVSHKNLIYTKVCKILAFSDFNQKKKVLKK